VVQCVEVGFAPLSPKSKGLQAKLIELPCARVSRTDDSRMILLNIYFSGATIKENLPRAMI
jgi:hypothetical protein